MASPIGSFDKSSPELVARFRELAALVPEATVKPMFGYPSCQFHGYMFLSLFKEAVVLRLDEADREEFCRAYDAEPFAPMPGRVMKGFVLVPDAVLNDPAVIAEWIHRSYAFVDGLPPKPARKPKLLKNP